MDDVISDTQRDSWESLQDTVEGKRRRVLDVISNSSRGATLFEICKVLGWPVNRISGRVTELRKNGRIVDSGYRRENPESGKSGIVWRLADG